MKETELMVSVFDDSEKGLAPNLLRFTSLLRAKFEPITYNNTLYVCDPETCLYSENKGQIQEYIQECCELVAYDKPLEVLKRELVGRLHDTNVVLSYPFNQFKGFPVGNGVVTFNGLDMEVVPYRPDMLYTYRTPVDYDENADRLLSRNVLSQWVDADSEGGKDVKILYQIPAQAILQALPGREPSKKAYLIMGESNGGKSSYLSMLSKLFDGMRNFGGVSLQTMGSRDSFWKASLVGKLLNVSDDLQSVPMDSTESLKQITGLRQHEVNPKGKDRYMAELTAVHVFTCNKPPEVRGNADTDDAFWGRWEYILFPFVFDKVDGWEDKTFTDEFLKGYLVDVLNIAKWMYQNNRLLVRSEGYDVKEKWINESSPLSEFLADNTTQTNGKWIYTRDLFAKLLEWRDDPGVSEAERSYRMRRSPDTLTALSQSMLGKGYNKKTVQRKGVRKDAYMDISWKENALFAFNESSGEIGLDGG